MEKETIQQEKYYQEEDEIDLREIIAVIWRRKKVILTIIVLVVLVATIYAFIKKPVYETSTTIYLGTINTPNNSSNNLVNSIYTDTKNAKEIMLSDDFIIQLTNQLPTSGKKEGYESIKSKISVDEIKDTAYLQIKVKDTDPKEGQEIAEKMVESYSILSGKDYNKNANLINQQLNTVQDQLKAKDDQMSLVKKEINRLDNNSLANNNQNEMRINSLYDQMRDADSQRTELLDKYLDLQKEQNALVPLQVINQPKTPQSPVEPKKPLILAISLVFGCVLGVFVAFIQEYFAQNPLNLKE